MKYKALFLILIIPLISFGQIRPDLQTEVDSVHNNLDVYTMVNGIIQRIGLDSLKAWINEGASAQTLSFSSPNVSISAGNSVDISAIDTELTEEEVQDFVNTLFANGTHTLISAIYNDVAGRNT